MYTSWYTLLLLLLLLEAAAVNKIDNRCPRSAVLKEMSDSSDEVR